VAGLLLLEAVAYARIANLPPQTGIIALLIGLIGYGLLGRSRFAIVSATSSSAAVLAAATASIDIDPTHRIILAFGLVLVTGAILLLAAVARMGSFTEFIAKPVLRGFGFGFSALIALKQIASIAGIHTRSGDAPQLLIGLVNGFDRWNWHGLAIGTGAFILLSLLARMRHMPAALLVIALGILLGKFVDLTQWGVAVVGHIEFHLSSPSVTVLPRVDWLRLGELGFAMAMILYSESYGSIRTFAVKHGDDVSPNRDLMSLGICNLISGCVQGLPVGAGFSATSANEGAGAVSRNAGRIAAAVIFILVLTMLPFIALTPEPILAAIVIHAVSHGMNPEIFKRYFVWHRDRRVMVAAVIAVLILGVLDGLLAAIAFSLFMMLRRFSESEIVVLGRLGRGHDFVDIHRHPEAQQIDGILILRPDEPIFFANIDRILHQTRQLIVDTATPIYAIIFSLEESPDLDSSSLEALQTFAQQMTASGKKLYFARLKYSAHQVLQRVFDDEAFAPVLSTLSVDETVALAQTQ